MLKLPLKYIVTLFIVVCSFQCEPVTVKKSEKDAGSTLEMKRNDNLEIVLKANPTTGYQWEIASIDTTILKNTGTEYKADKVPPGVVGSGGKSIIRFKAIKAGRTFLKLVYHRPFEGDAQPAKEFELNVIVKY